MNCINSQGENIADNGGLKQSYRVSSGEWYQHSGRQIADNGGLKQKLQGKFR